MFSLVFSRGKIIFTVEKGQQIMQKLLGLLRRCTDDYHMIEEGDRIAVGISGGKDSLALLVLMANLRRFYPKPFELQAITIDMGLSGMDFTPVAELCESLGVSSTRVEMLFIWKLTESCT